MRPLSLWSAMLMATSLYAFSQKTVPDASKQTFVGTVVAAEQYSRLYDFGSTPTLDDFIFEISGTNSSRKFIKVSYQFVRKASQPFSVIAGLDTWKIEVRRDRKCDEKIDTFVRKDENSRAMRYFMVNASTDNARFPAGETFECYVLKPGDFTKIDSSKSSREK
jgi:hypothetical protein